MEQKKSEKVVLMYSAKHAFDFEQHCNSVPLEASSKGPKCFVHVPGQVVGIKVMWKVKRQAEMCPCNYLLAQLFHEVVVFFQQLLLSYSVSSTLDIDTLAKKCTFFLQKEFF